MFTMTCDDTGELLVVQLIVKIVCWVMGPEIWLPEIGPFVAEFVGEKLLSVASLLVTEQLFVLVEVQVMVELLPDARRAGFAVMIAAGAVA